MELVGGGSVINGAVAVAVGFIGFGATTGTCRDFLVAHMLDLQFE